MTNSPYLRALMQRVLVFDGAMGTSIQRYNLDEAGYGGCYGCTDYLSVANPRIIEEIHTSYMEAGADVLETDTFGGSYLKLEEYGLGARAYEINRAAAALARQVADRFSTPDWPRFVAGSMGPTGMLPSSDDPTLSNITYDQLADMFGEQARALIDGGVDLLIIETTQDILELKAAIAGVVRYFKRSGRRVPIQAQVTLDTTGRMLLGTDIAAALATLEALPVDIIGLNCSTGPEHMREPIRYLAEHCSRPVSCIPNAGLPLNIGGQAVYPLEPEPMAATLAEFVRDFHIEIVGGCCGTGPDHIRALVAAIRALPRVPRQVEREAVIASGMRGFALRQVPAPTLVGERVNATGSRKVKRLLLTDDYDGILDVAREQVEGGAHALDVTVALTERMDEAEQMRRVVRKLRASIEAPLVIDSTEADVIEIALKNYPGRAIVNSINMERGRERIEAVIPHVVEHGAAVIAMPIDEEGMTHTAERKVAVSKRIFDICTQEYGLPADAIIFDVQTFPVTTGQEDLRNSAVATLDGIRGVKVACPGCSTILGVSNVSFGIQPHARAVLNSVFLHHAVEAGLDLAIVNPVHITPYAEIDAEQRALADDLILNSREDALPRYIAYFEEHGPAEDGGAEQADPTAGMTVAEKIHWQILHRRKDGIEALLEEALQTHTPVGVLNDILLPAMKDVGDKFGAGELILPFVLQSAEVMKRAVAHLEQYFEKKEGYTKGRVVLATVFGDVHDIGKSLVNTILTNNGYTVYDLGKQVPINVILDKAQEVGATAIGLSALLVNTSKQMPLCVQELQKRGLDFPVLIGGAAINRAFGYRIGFVGDDGARYEPGVYYCKDAFEGLDTMEALTDPANRAAFVQKIHTAAVRAANAEVPEDQLAAQGAGRTERSPKIQADVPIPTPPFWGWGVLNKIPPEDVFACLDLNTLFRLHWGGKGKHDEEWESLVASEFMPRLERMKRDMIARRIIQPQVIYGYFPCASDGNQLVIYDPADMQASATNGNTQHATRNTQLSELVRFDFPRQPDREHLCLADFWAPESSGRIDVVALQVVTVGDRAIEHYHELQAAGNYAEALFVHGLGVSTAEALAEYTQQRVRRELGLDPEQGRRYSWGYPACPDLEEHSKLFQVLPATDEIGVRLTTAYQLDPEASTAAIVTHHPQSKYFTTRPVRQRRPTNGVSAPADGDAAREMVAPGVLAEE